MSTSTADPSLISQLKEMGISEKTAKFALEKQGNDAQRAVDYIFSGAAGKDEVRRSTINSTASSPPTIPTAPYDPATHSKKWSIRGRRKTSQLTSSDPSSSLAALTPLAPTETRSPPSPPLESVDDEMQINETHVGQSADLILGALGRDASAQSQSQSQSRGRQPDPAPMNTSPQDSRTTRLSVFGGLRSTSGTSTPPRSPTEEVPSQPLLSIQPSKPVGGSKSPGSSSGGPRSASPFFRARRSRDKARAREKENEEIGALRADGAESDGEGMGGDARGRGQFRPQASAYEDADESEVEGDPLEGGTAIHDLDDDELDEMDGLFFDEETEKNTEANAFFNEEGEDGGEGNVLDRFGEETEQDILGEGPNVVVPPQPLFQTSTMSRPAPPPEQGQQPKRKKSVRSNLEMQTSRPSFARDRCTMTITNGDPDGALEQSGKRMRRYVVLSDLSDESRYAVEWAIGTVARDGDEVFLISVREEEGKVDPKSWSGGDKAKKLSVQKERQGVTLQLVRQVTSLLQRTRLNITVTCQFLHAKNARHMLLDMIDFLEPTMAIVGSRGLGKLKGILLGSTSHYLVQKSSVPVMVARRRLQRPLRKTDPANLRHSPRVGGLASAGIEKAASTKQEDEVVDVAQEDEVEESHAQAAKQP